jgi:hypothetical protein
VAQEQMRVEVQRDIVASGRDLRPTASKSGSIHQIKDGPDSTIPGSVAATTAPALTMMPARPACVGPSGCVGGPDSRCKHTTIGVMLQAAAALRIELTSSACSVRLTDRTLPGGKELAEQFIEITATDLSSPADRSYRSRGM